MGLVQNTVKRAVMVCTACLTGSCPVESDWWLAGRDTMFRDVKLVNKVQQLYLVYFQLLSQYHVKCHMLMFTFIGFSDNGTQVLFSLTILDKYFGIV